jgi:hypothetical protein
MLKGKDIALLWKIQAFQKLRPKELLSIGVSYREVELSPCRGRHQALNDRDIRHLVCLSDLHPGEATVYSCPFYIEQ